MVTVGEQQFQYGVVHQLKRIADALEKGNGGDVVKAAARGPFPRTMHYSTEQPGDSPCWEGMGTDLKPICGQSEWILISSVPQVVDCLKCKAKMPR